MAEWKEYTGAPEQIKEIANPKNYLIVDSEYSIFCSPTKVPIDINDEWVKLYFEKSKVKFYLICTPHPYEEMICQWARSRQPVYIRYINEECDELVMQETTKPDWNITGAEYSFTPFKE